MGSTGSLPNSNSPGPITRYFCGNVDPHHQMLVISPRKSPQKYILIRDTVSVKLERLCICNHGLLYILKHLRLNQVSTSEKCFCSMIKSGPSRIPRILCCALPDLCQQSVNTLADLSVRIDDGDMIPRYWPKETFGTLWDPWTLGSDF